MTVMEKKEKEVQTKGYWREAGVELRGMCRVMQRVRGKEMLQMKEGKEVEHK